MVYNIDNTSLYKTGHSVVREPADAQEHFCIIPSALP